MEKLLLKNFKSFEEEFLLEINHKNLLIYGENGAGKSSLFEAFKVIFFNSRLSAEIPSASTPEEQEQKNRDFWDKYNNSISNIEFEIDINNDNYRVFDTDSYQVFMISHAEINVDSEINLESLLNHFYIEVPINTDSFCDDCHSYIETEVNEALSLFFEDIEIEIDRQDSYAIKILDKKRSIERKKNLNIYFNEAKLNLILLLLFFHIIRYAADVTKKRIIVLDDFITSLDVANRTFIMKSIFKYFSNTDYQLFIFTHNVNFYNLAMYLINDTFRTRDNWIFGNMYEYEKRSRFFIKDQIQKVEQIQKIFKDTPEEIDRIGNIIRQKFEVLLYEYSKLFMIGAVEDSNKILDRIIQSKCLYYNNKKTAIELVDELHQILNNGVYTKLRERLNSKISSFSKNNFSNLQQILIDIKLYRKLTLHPLSHGRRGLTTFTAKEIEKSIDVLKKLEDNLKAITDKDISGA